MVQQGRGLGLLDARGPRPPCLVLPVHAAHVAQQSHPEPLEPLEPQVPVQPVSGMLWATSMGLAHAASQMLPADTSRHAWDRATHSATPRPGPCRARSSSFDPFAVLLRPRVSPMSGPATEAGEEYTG